jgi:hypothetical protein
MRLPNAAARWSRTVPRFVRVDRTIQEEAEIMRNMLALLAAGAIAVAALGWYLGWYHLQTTPTADGHRQINVDVNTKKIVEDVNKEIKQGSAKIDEVLHSKGQSQGSTPPSVGTQPGAPVSTSTGRFRVEKDIVVDTEGVSSPVPIK